MRIPDRTKMKTLPPHKPEATPPDIGTKFYFPCMEDPDLVAWAIWYGDNAYEDMMLDRGQVFLEEAHALAWARWIADVMGGVR
jgi:hypothetical protein